MSASDQVEELQNIKKLLILLLRKNEVSQDEIARALGVDQSAVSRMINPRGKPPKKGEETAQDSQVS